jgi:hypothetical protein
MNTTAIRIRIITGAIGVAFTAVAAVRDPGSPAE